MDPPSPASQPRPSTGVRLGNYELLLELASGGMATVYVARQLGAAGFERLVVVKRVHRHLLSNAAFTGMFLDEANVASRIRHPNVVPVIDVVEADRELFLVMDYVESTTVARLRYTMAKLRKRVPAPIVARVIADTLAGLHAAHEATDVHGAPMNVVHRDVSPQNILVGVDGMARLIDFGIAKAAHRITETQTGSLKGKYGYMSPEQTRAGDLDRRSDLFALGIVFYEVLTGHRIFHAESEYEIVRRINEEDVRPPSSLASDVPTALDPVILKALARPREERFATAAEFLDALEAATPLASHREVATFVNELFDTQLRERRETLRALVTGAAEPDLGETDRPAQKPKDAPKGGTEPPIALLPADAASSTTRAELEVLHPRPPNRTKAAVAGGLALAVVVAVALYARTAHGPNGAAPPVDADRSGGTASASVAQVVPSNSASAPASPSAAPAATEVELVLLADRKIVGIQAEGLKRIEPGDQRARIAVLPWTGDLSIEATLAGGVQARAVARSDGPRELLLKVEAPAAVKPRPSATASGPKPLEINRSR